MNRVSVALLLLLVVSALYQVRTSYESRRLFTATERARNEQRALATERAHLQADLSTAATKLRVEADARTRLGMRVATPDTTLYVAAPSASGGAQ